MGLKFNNRTKSTHTRIFDNKLKAGASGITANSTQKEKRWESIKKTGGTAGVWAADKSGCAWWRLEMPRLALHYGGRADIQVMCKIQTDVEALAGLDAYIVQRHMLGIHLEHMDFLKGISKLSGSSLIFDIDDICVGEDIPQYNAMRGGYQSPELEKQFKEAVHKCDEMHVCSQYMADYYRNRLEYDRITVVPNLPLDMWYGNLHDAEAVQKNYYKNRRRPRVVWAGSATHLDVLNKAGQKDDFAHITKTVIKTLNEFKWVFLGGVPRILEPYAGVGQIEVYPWTPLFKYPQTFKNLNAQAVIAPLTDNHFNRAKSNIKWVEAGLMGINGAFQDMETYQDARYKFTTGDEMIDQIREIVRDDGRYLRESEAIAKKMKSEFILDTDENRDMLYSSFFTPYGSENRRLGSKKLYDLNPTQF